MLLHDEITHHQQETHTHVQMHTGHHNKCQARIRIHTFDGKITGKNKNKPFFWGNNTNFA